MTVPDTADDGHLHTYSQDGYCVRCSHIQDDTHRGALRIGSYDDDSYQTMLSCTIHVEWEHVFTGDFTLTALDEAAQEHIAEDDI